MKQGCQNLYARKAQWRMLPAAHVLYSQVCTYSMLPTTFGQGHPLVLFVTLGVR
jgi:hypothetical protein